MQYDLGRTLTVAPNEADHETTQRVSDPYGRSDHRLNENITPGSNPDDLLENEQDTDWGFNRKMLKNTFKEFITYYRISAEDTLTLDYKKQLQSNLYAGKQYIEVDWEHASSFSPDLGTFLREHAMESILLFEEVLREIAEDENYFPTAFTVSHDIQLQIVWDTNITRLREIGIESISHLVCVPGLVAKVGKTKLRCVRAILQCQSCKSAVSLPVSKDLELPKRCISNVNPLPGTPTCRPSPYTLLSQSCEYEDRQIIKLQELPSEVPTGEMPRCVNVVVDRCLTDRVAPGNRVVVVAVNVVSEGRKRAPRSAVGLRSQYLRCVGLMPLSQGFETFDPGMQHGLLESPRELTLASKPNAEFLFRPLKKTVRLPIWRPEEERQFEELAKRPSLYEDIASSIDPAVYGAIKIKKAIACLLFGGTRKRTSDRSILRGDMNVLLMGDPSTAKSQLLKYVEKVAPIGLYTSGKGGSAAGLTAAVVRSVGGEWWLEAGSLVLADGGVVCIDIF